MSKQQTKNKFVDAFFSLYKEKPINKISIKTICDKAGFHRSTFYEYYMDIYDLLEQEEQAIYTLQKELILTPLENGTLTIGTPSFLISLKQLFQQKGDKIVQLIGINGDPSFRKNLQDRIKLAIMPQVQKKFGPHAAYLAEFLSAGILSTCETAYKNKEDIDTVLNNVYPFISKIFL